MLQLLLSIGETVLLDCQRQDEVGAVWAVAKTLNLFPIAPTDLDKPILIGHSHTKIYVLHSPEEKKFYQVVAKPEDFALIVLAIGKLPNYDIVGWARPKNMTSINNHDGYQIFHHIFTPLSDEVIYKELIG